MEEAMFTDWLDEPGRSLMADALKDPEGERLLGQAASQVPETPDAWHDLIRRCARYGRAPLLDAVLDAAPADAFDNFQLGGNRSLLPDACFALIVDRIWLPRIDGLDSLWILDVTLSRYAVGRVAEIIRASARLQRLALLRCELDSDAVHMLWSALLDARCPLRQLSLSSNPIGSALTRAVAGGRYPKQLSELDLSGVGLAEEDGIALATAMKNWSTLKVLNLEGNAIGDRAGAALLGAAVGHPNLKALNLENCSLASRSAGAFLKLVASAGAVRSLMLSDNDLSALPKGIGAALKVNVSLHHLFLSGARLTAASVDDLLRGLAGSSCGLLTLDLAHNALTSLDASPLSTNTKLEDLSLEGNPLSAATYKSLGAALGAHPALARMHLEIGSNGNDSIERLTECLARNRSLQQLTLQGPTTLTHAQMSALVAAVEGHPALKVLHVPYELLDNQQMHALFEALIRNNLALTDVVGADFDWYPNSGAPAPIDRYLARNDRADNDELIKALHEVIKKSVVLIGFGALFDDLRREIALLWLGRKRAKSVEALRSALRLRQVNKALGSVPMPDPDRLR